MSSSSVRKRLYDPEKGRGAVYYDDEAQNHEIRETPLSSIAIIIGMGLLFVLLGVKWRDRITGPQHTIASAVASAISASNIDQAQAQQQVQVPQEDTNHQIVPAKENEAFLDIKNRFFERARMANLNAGPTTISDEFERVALLSHPENTLEREGSRHALETSLGLQAQPMEGAETMERGWVMDVDSKFLPEGAKKVTIISSSHVPCYDGGGGKHGISRLVRFVSAPSTPKSLGTEKDLSDFCRWHCRLSHVTAHTRTLTVDSENLHQEAKGEEAAKVEMEDIWDFIGLKKDNGLLAKAQAALQQYFVEHDPKESKISFPSHLVPVFEQEVQRMASWPCGIFEGEHRLLLNAACDQSYVKCTIPYDLCDKQQCN